MRYGHLDSSSRGFSWKHGISRFIPHTGIVITSQRLDGEADFPTSPAYRLKSRIPTRDRPTLLRTPLTSLPPLRWYRNINLFSIAYAFRPQLRHRLTLSRLPLPRKPWTYGVPVSHRHYRYSCLHKLFQYLQWSLRSTFAGDWNAPLPPCQNRSSDMIRSFGIAL